MKVLFVSNDLTHHLVPFFESLLSIYGRDNCTFAVLEPCEGRHRMGFPTYNESWVFAVYERTQKEYMLLYENADIIITRVWDNFGVIENSLKKGKLVFYASERWFKPTLGKGRLLLPSYLSRYLKYKRLSNYSNFYYLAMGFYASLDFKFLGLCKNRIFNFGYFTPPFRGGMVEISKKKTIEILWAGRLLHWKRVIDLILVFENLVEHYNVNLTIIGEGPTRKRLEKYTNDNKIPNVVFKEFVGNEDLKRTMLDSDIYVLPSSGYEGWGAVINEAMQTKCAVIVAKETGSAKSMIVDGVNGLTFSTGDRRALKTCLIKLLEDKDLLHKLKEEGYKTITEIWSGSEAGDRFSIIVERIKKGESIDVYRDGPMQIIG